MPSPAASTLPHSDGMDPLGEQLVFIRRHLHANPELGYQEHETSRFIHEMLEAHGFDVVGPIAGTGLYVDLEGARPGRTIAYRADIDALPILDAKEVSYRSANPGIAHLCGHDAHTAIAIGVLLILKEHRDLIHGRVRVFFQPNEEGNPSGAPRMIREGVLEGCSAVYAVHVDPTLPTGVFGLKSGPITAAYDGFVIHVKGPSTGHSARPHQTADTVWISTQIANALYQITGRLQDVRNPAVLTLCRFRAGEALNVIPDHVEFGGTLRSTNESDRVLLRMQIEQTARQLAALYGAEAEVQFKNGAPGVDNDEALIETAFQTTVQLFGKDAAFRVPQPSMGSEDFAFYLEHLPGALIRVGTANGPATSYPLHDARFDLDEQALGPAARLLAHTLINALQKPHHP